MKKVLSVLLAAAMVMGMSVSAFAADKVWGTNSEYAGISKTSVEDLYFDDVMYVVPNDGTGPIAVDEEGLKKNEYTVHPGDTLYFKIMSEGERSIMGEPCNHDHAETEIILELTTDLLKLVNQIIDSSENNSTEIDYEALQAKFQEYSEKIQDMVNGLEISELSCYTINNINLGDLFNNSGSISSAFAASDIATVAEDDESNNNIQVDIDYDIETGSYSISVGSYLTISMDCTHLYGADEGKHDSLCGYVADIIKEASDKGEYWGEIDKNWSINIKTNDYIQSASFATEKHMMNPDASNNLKDNRQPKFIKLVLDETYDVKENDEIDFYFYIADNDSSINAHKEISSKGAVHFLFDNYLIKHVEFDFANDVDHMARWIVEEGKKGVAVFDFEDAAYFTVKMGSEESVIFNFKTGDYLKSIEKAFDYEADYTYYNFRGESDDFYRTGELFIPAKDDTFIYGWETSKLVEVDAEYVKNHKVDGQKMNGWLIETNELGYYVVADVEVEVEADDEVKEEASSTGNKVNPETGANDFVGAAVALAVVSVAAAGALAFKK